MSEFHVDTTWIHVFKELIRSGDWAKMKPSAAKLYVTLKAYVNWQSGEAFPKVETLMEYSGLSRPSVISALKELESLRLIVKRHEEGESGNYSVVEKFAMRLDKEKGSETMAEATFEYIPNHIRGAVEEVRNFAMKGVVPETGAPVNIQIGILNVQIVKGKASQFNQPNLTVGKEEAEEMKKKARTEKSDPG